MDGYFTYNLSLNQTVLISKFRILESITKFDTELLILSSSIKRLKVRIAVQRNPSQRYGASLGIWNYLPPDTSERPLILDLPTPERWKADLT